MANQLANLFVSPFPSWISSIRDTPQYETGLGRAFCADALEICAQIPDNSIDLIFTSPPYALEFKKDYGNVSKKEYVSWFLDFAHEFKRILKPDGSFVLNIAGSYNKGTPTKSIYQYKLLVELIETVGLHLAQEFYWHNPAKMPAPAEWVTVRRIRVKDSVEHLWWFGKTPYPKASNRKVLSAYSADMIRLNKRKLEKTTRPSGYNINESFAQIDSGGSIPSNVLEEPLELNEYASNFIRSGNNAANDKYTLACKSMGIKPHPARFPSALPSFFIKMLTEEGDVVFDPFAGSNTTGMIAEQQARVWLSTDLEKEYVEASKFRFFL